MNQVPRYYSLEAEEKRVFNNLVELNKLVDDYGLPEKPAYLQEEIAFLQRELEFLKQEKNKKYADNTSYRHLALLSA